MVVGKLSRGGPQIEGFDAGAAEKIVAQCREGCGLYHALKDAGITQRRYFAWIVQAHAADHQAEPYRQFRRQLLVADAERAARTGIEDPGRHLVLP